MGVCVFCTVYDGTVTICKCYTLSTHSISLAYSSFSVIVVVGVVAASSAPRFILMSFACAIIRSKLLLCRLQIYCYQPKIRRAHQESDFI